MNRLETIWEKPPHYYDIHDLKEEFYKSFCVTPETIHFEQCGHVYLKHQQENVNTTTCVVCSRTSNTPLQHMKREIYKTVPTNIESVYDYMVMVRFYTWLYEKKNNFYI